MVDFISDVSLIYLLQINCASSWSRNLQSIRSYWHIFPKLCLAIVSSSYHIFH